MVNLSSPLTEERCHHVNTQRRRTWIGAAGALLTAALLSTGAAGTSAAAPAPTAAPAASPIVSVPVSFTVQNINRTTVACPSDGKTYTIKGHITGTAASLAKPTATTLYLHAVTQGEFYWNFNGAPNYNVANQQAANGHVSVTIDRLGYGASDKPPGLDSCMGSQADTAHQVVQALRTGAYKVGSGAPAKFSKVFLAGHSAGGLIATIESYTFRDIDGLINYAWSDTTTSAFLTTQLSKTEARCLTNAAGVGGILAPIGLGSSGTPKNYEPFGDDVAGILFHSATPQVRAAVPAPNPDPCGDLLSIPAALVADAVGVSTDTAPVLILGGENDALFPAPDMQLQALRYIASPSVTVKVFPNTAHGLNYEASHLDQVALVSSWLTARGA